MNYTLLWASDYWIIWLSDYLIVFLSIIGATTLGGRMSIRVLPASFLIDLHFWSPAEIEICTFNLWGNINLDFDMMLQKCISYHSQEWLIRVLGTLWTLASSGLTSWQIWEGLVGELVDLVDHFRQVVVKLVTIHEVFEGRDLVVGDFPLPLQPVGRESSKC